MFHFYIIFYICEQDLNFVCTYTQTYEYECLVWVECHLLVGREHVSLYPTQ